MEKFKLSGIDIDLEKYVIKLYFPLKPKEPLILYFKTPSRRFLCSLIALIVIKMKKKGRVCFVSVNTHKKELKFLDQNISGKNASKNSTNRNGKIRKAWRYKLPNLARGYCFEVLDRRKITEPGPKEGEYDCSDMECDIWANLFQHSEDNTWHYKFGVDEVGIELDDVKIIFKQKVDDQAWEEFKVTLRAMNQKSFIAEKKQIQNAYAKKAETSISSDNEQKNQLKTAEQEREDINSKLGIESATHQTLGRELIAWKPCVVNINGFKEGDIIISPSNKKLQLPQEIRKLRREIYHEWEEALRKGEEHPWYGVAYGLEKFNDDRANLSERQILTLSLHPTDSFGFLAVQKGLQIPTVSDENMHKITIKDKYLKNFDAFNPVSWIAQSISPAILLTVKDNNEEVTIFARRSNRNILATGKNLIALPIDETPRRCPNEEELKLLERDDSQSIQYDKLDGLFINAIVRGAEEELGIDLPKETIKILAFGLETNRYLYSLLGIARTDLTLNYVNNCIATAKDNRLEFKYLFPPVPFTPESVYEFFASKKREELCPTTQFASYYALCHSFGEKTVAKVFENYPDPI